MKPKLLDLFCGAGGASMGLYRAGFDVTGVDIKPQPRYPFEFHQADALTYPLDGYDAYWASPPCQEYSRTKSLKTSIFPTLIEPVRIKLIATGKPFVIENVPGAPLINPLILCGSMFGLRVRRHRIFEINPPVYFPPFSCNHWGKCTGAGRNRVKAGVKGRTLSLNDGFAFLTVAGNDYLVNEGKKAMGIDWMIRSELSQAIPPAYAEYLGNQLIRAIQ